MMCYIEMLDDNKDEHMLLCLPLQVGVALSYALWAVSNNFLLFVLARVVGGLSKGNVSLSTAIVTDVTSVEKRSKGMVSASRTDVSEHLVCSV